MNTAWLRILGIVVASWLIVAWSCQPSDVPIPSGRYASESTKETILVADQKITFHVEIERSAGYVDATYGYTVLDGGRIQPYPMRSTEAAFGVGSVDWYWDDQKIVQKNPRNGEVKKIFIRQP